MTNNQLAKPRFITPWIVLLPIVFFVLYMHYLFPREWAESMHARAFVEAMAIAIPSIRRLITNVPNYTPYWGVFFAAFWCLSPLYLSLGIRASSKFSESGRQIMRSRSLTKYFAADLFFLAIAAIPYCFPFTGNFPNPLMNQMSDSLVLLILAWVTTAVSIFMLGLAIGATFQRILLKSLI